MRRATSQRRSITRRPVGRPPSWLQSPCRRRLLELHTIHLSSTAPTIGTAWVRSASARSRTTLPTGRFAPGGRRRLGAAGRRGVRPGWLRWVGPGWPDWAVEAFRNEAAVMARVDPVAFRIALLDGVGRN